MKIVKLFILTFGVVNPDVQGGYAGFAFLGRCHKDMDLFHPFPSFFLKTNRLLLSTIALRFASLGDVVTALPHLWVARLQNQVSN